MTQEELSISVGASESYIGNVENPKEPQKTNHQDEINEDAGVVSNMEILTIRPLTEKEIFKFERETGRYKFRKISKT